MLCRHLKRHCPLISRTHRNDRHCLLLKDMPMSKRYLPASEYVLSMIHALSNRVTRAFSTEVEPKFDITLAEWPVIVMLSQRPGATANEVTQRWSMEKMTVNRAIRKLEAADAISRTRKRPDKRSYELNLTKRGILLAANARYHQIISVFERTGRCYEETFEAVYPRNLDCR